MTIPTFDIDLLQPGSIQADVVGASIEGGRALSGITGSIDMSGGGLIRLSLNRIMLHTPQQHRYWNRLAAYLRGGVNKIYVPLLNDAMYPYPGDAYGNKPVQAGPFWVGTPYVGDDLNRYQWFTATLFGSAAINAGTISIRTTDGRDQTLHRTLNPLALEGGEWFSIDHGGDTGPRLYRISEIDSASGSAATTTQTWGVGISPPLRAAATSGATITFWRPVGTMGLPPDETMAWIPNSGWFGEHSLNLIEKF